MVTVPILSLARVHFSCLCRRLDLPKNPVVGQVTGVSPFHLARREYRLVLVFIVAGIKKKKKKQQQQGGKNNNQDKIQNISDWYISATYIVVYGILLAHVSATCVVITIYIPGCLAQHILHTPIHILD